MWEYSVGPPTPKLCIQLKWWGEKSPGTTFRYFYVFNMWLSLHFRWLYLNRVPVQVDSVSKRDLGDSTSLAYYPIRSALSQLSAYLKGELTLLCILHAFLLIFASRYGVFDISSRTWSHD